MVKRHDNLVIPFLSREISMQEGKTTCSLTISSSPSTKDLQVPPSPHTLVVHDVGERVRYRYGFSNSGRVIMPPPTASPAIISGIKKIHNKSDGSDGI